MYITAKTMSGLHGLDPQLTEKQIQTEKTYNKKQFCNLIANKMNTSKNLSKTKLCFLLSK